MNFLDVINPNQSLIIFEQKINRARLGLHLQLDKLAQEIEKAFIANDVAKASEDINAYFIAVGLDTESQSGIDQLIAYFQLLSLNQIQGSFAFQQWQGPDNQKPVAFHYDFRYIAWWVHKLSINYGWSRDAIFNLWPEEAAAYLQEILVHEVDDFERWRGLSEVSYRYDKSTKKSTFIPTPKPSWMVGSNKETTMKVRKSMLPIGNVIKLDEIVH